MIPVVRRWLDRYFADEEAVLVAVFLLLGIAIIVTLGGVLAPMITAVILAYLMQGVVDRLKSWGVSHLVAVSIAFLLLTGAIIVTLVFMLPVLFHQISNLLGEAPGMLIKGKGVLSVLPERYPHLVTPAQMQELIGLLHDSLGQMGQTLLSKSFSQIPLLVGILIYLVLVPILVFFFLKDSVSMLNWLSSVLPRKRPVMQQIWHEMNLQIANYVRGKFVEIVIVATVSSITFGFLGLHYALLLGIMTGFSVLIPYLGAAVATFPVAFIAFFQWGWTDRFAWVIAAYGIIQALDGNALVPWLFSEAVKIHPVVIILAVLVFGGLWGFWGVFFAIPLATLCKAVIKAWPTKARIDSEEQNWEAPQ